MIFSPALRHNKLVIQTLFFFLLEKADFGLIFLAKYKNDNNLRLHISVYGIFGILVICGGNSTVLIILEYFLTIKQPLFCRTCFAVSGTKLKWSANYRSKDTHLRGIYLGIMSSLV